MLEVKPIKTSIFKKGDNLSDFIIDHTTGLDLENRVLAVTSKIVSLNEGRVLPQSKFSKEQIVRNEADTYIGATDYECHLTIKEGLLIPSAGIDESNSLNNEYILYPQDPFLSAKKIHSDLRQKLGIKKLGVLLTDSHTTPLRRGVTGVALAYYGFEGVENKQGTKDLFGRELKMTQINIADALAAASVLTMGEGNESKPLAVIKHPLNFIAKDSNDELKIPINEDLYYPLLNRKG